jgi:hypothetical protein
MKIDKEQWLYMGIGAFVFLVMINSTKKVPLQEVSSVPKIKSFDASSLPYPLRPPMRMADGEPEPKTLAKRKMSFDSIGYKPRFDT